MTISFYLVLRNHFKRIKFKSLKRIDFCVIKTYNFKRLKV